MLKDELIERIQAHKARIGVVGLGYVGLPLVLRFGEERFPVLGFDVDPVKVRKLNAGESYIRHIQAERLRGRYSIARGEADAPDIDGRVYVRAKGGTAPPVGQFAQVKVIGHTDYDLIAEPA